MSSFSHHVLLYLRTLYIVLSLVRRRVVSPGSNLCTTFLKIPKHYKTVAVRLRFIFQLTYVQYCTCAITVLVIIKLTKFADALWLRCASCWLIFDIISSCFAKFKNVVHKLTSKRIATSVFKTSQLSRNEFCTNKLLSG